MRITGRSAGFLLPVFLAAATALACGYLIGYWTVSGEAWTSAITGAHMAAMPLPVTAGLVLVAGAFSLIAGRLAAYAAGEGVRPVTLIVASLFVWAAMYMATYDTFELLDVYPFAGLFVISLLLFRMETRGWAAILFGVMVMAFFVMSAKELGERDAENLQRASGPRIEYVIET